MGPYSPAIARFGQKFQYLKNIAIRWRLLGRIILQFTKDWDKIRETNLSQSLAIGINIFFCNIK